MEDTKDPEYLRTIATAVARFRDALQQFLQLHIMNVGPTAMARGTAPAVIPKSGATPEMRAEAQQKVSEAAGAAADAVRLTQSYMMVRGINEPVDAIVNWITITRPQPLLEANDVLDVCSVVLGKLDTMMRLADASVTHTPPPLGPASLHRTVWDAAARFWTMHMFPQAVHAASEALVQHVKDINGHNELSDTDAWTQIFSQSDPAPGRPRLRWPGNPKDRHVKTMNEGLLRLAPGLSMTIRNPAAHGSHDLDEQEAFEQLAALSMLARWLDVCEVQALTDPGRDCGSTESTQGQDSMILGAQQSEHHHDQIGDVAR